MRQTMRLGILGLVAFAIFSFAMVTSENKQIDMAESTIEWVGKKITGQHSGNIDFKSGHLTFEAEELIGGTFVVNMNSINVTDIEGRSKSKLERHLKSKDFFGVEENPTSQLVFKEVKGSAGKYEITADLTIKEITAPVQFELNLTEHTGIASLMIDRTAYDIKYGSASFFDNLKNKAIDNEFQLTVSLKF
jgi:polyisoprenoid-binding protein YceI